jgi:hypothetical protein
MTVPSRVQSAGRRGPTKPARKGGSAVDSWRYPVIALVVVLAFFAAYSYALGEGGASPTALQAAAYTPQQAYTDQGQPVASPAVNAQAAAGGGGAAAGGCCGGGGGAPGATAAGGGGGGCCGGGNQKKIQKAAKAVGSEQVIDLTVNGNYNPNYITAKAGLPLRIKIDHPSQGGCDGTLVFPDLGIRKDLAPASRDEIVIGPAKAGTYRFTCGMGMLSGTLVLK